MDADPQTWLGIAFVPLTIDAPHRSARRLADPGEGSRPGPSSCTVAERLRAELLRMLPAYRELALPCLLITYRNDRGAPRVDGGGYRLGFTEWHDVDDGGPLRHRARGARRRPSSGAAWAAESSLELLRKSTLRRDVRAAVLDAPALDWGRGAALNARQRRAPPRSASLRQVRHVAALRNSLGRLLVQVRHAAGSSRPAMLIVHGERDDAVSDRRVATLSPPPGRTSCVRPVPRRADTSSRARLATATVRGASSPIGCARAESGAPSRSRRRGSQPGPRASVPETAAPVTAEVASARPGAAIIGAMREAAPPGHPRHPLRFDGPCRDTEHAACSGRAIGASPPTAASCGSTRQPTDSDSASPTRSASTPGGDARAVPALRSAQLRAGSPWGVRHRLAGESACSSRRTRFCAATRSRFCLPKSARRRKRASARRRAADCVYQLSEDGKRILATAHRAPVRDRAL